MIIGGIPQNLFGNPNSSTKESLRLQKTLIQKAKKLQIQKCLDTCRRDFLDFFLFCYYRADLTINKRVRYSVQIDLCHHQWLQLNKVVLCLSLLQKKIGIYTITWRTRWSSLFTASYSFLTVRWLTARSEDSPLNLPSPAGELTSGLTFGFRTPRERVTWSMSRRVCSGQFAVLYFLDVFFLFYLDKNFGQAKSPKIWRLPALYSKNVRVFFLKFSLMLLFEHLRLFHIRIVLQNRRYILYFRSTLFVRTLRPKAAKMYENVEEPFSSGRGLCYCFHPLHGTKRVICHVKIVKQCQ